ncbi:terminase large subunit, partial [Candidatus Nomurabacteria bacterium]|nr:terminase large subunit [Candidatus Nomurabacteria bacterium]
GEFNNKYFILENWQVFIIGNIFGWIRKDTWLRRYKNVYIQVAKKNGKTFLCAALSLYMMLADGENAAEVILASNSREQAQNAFEAVSEVAKKLDTTGKYIQTQRNKCIYKNHKIRVVASDARKLEGVNPNCCILDEYHASSTSAVHDSLRSSQGNRNEPLFVIITTAGLNKKYPCYSYYTTGREVLSGLKTDDSTFYAIYNLDSEDNWKDPNNWIKSNPNINVSVKKDFINMEISDAINNITLETGVKTKTLNIWCDTITTWISSDYILKSSDELSITEIDKNTELIVGVDLSSNCDITSVSYMYKMDEKFHFINKYYLPEDSLNSVSDREYYRIQANKGNIILTPGNVVDYNYIIKDILEVNKTYFISKISYDNWNSSQFAISASENYLNLEPFSQTISNFNRPTKEFERLMLKGNIVLDNNEITRWMFSNVNLRYDSNGNCKPDKSKADKKIDGIISILMCLGTYLNTPHYQISFTSI